MKELIEKIFYEYNNPDHVIIPAQPVSTAKNASELFKNTIPNNLHHQFNLSRDKYYIEGSIGKGKIAIIPWICVYNKRITTNAKNGVYIVFLLSADRQSLYLSLMQGCTDIRKQYNYNKTVEILHKNNTEIQNILNNTNFDKGKIFLGEPKKLTELGRLYQEGTIYHVKYDKDNIPDENTIQNDFKNLLNVYDDYFNIYVNKMKDLPKTMNQKNEPTTNPKAELKPILSTKEAIIKINAYIQSKGFTYENGLIENFYLSLKSKPFVILAGTSGTGKTRLVKLFAEAVGATSDNGRYKMVPVRPDWSDSTDLFGHVNLNGEFVAGSLIQFIKNAQDNPKYPYFLCLDEMNLARVEYYLSDILSIIETRDFNGKNIKSDVLIPLSYYGKDELAKNKFGEIRFPENLYLIGTVNMDETTFPFSKKVLDRANTIEFSKVNLINNLNSTIQNVEPINLDNNNFKSEFLLLVDCKDMSKEVHDYCMKLQEINEILEKGNLQFGYRVRDEIIFYLLNNKKFNILKENQALDNEIMQKILPRIQGSSMFIKDILCKLFKLCAGNYDNYSDSNNQISAQMLKYIENNSCIYPNSANKIAFMVRRYEEDGFTSFWF